MRISLEAVVLLHPRSSLPLNWQRSLASLVRRLCPTTDFVLKLLLDLINVTICISVLSIGLSCVYAGSRTLCALAETGYAPAIFGYVDKSSRPLVGVVIGVLFGSLSYLQLATDGDAVCAFLFYEASCRN